MVYKSVNDHGPYYIADMLTEYHSDHQDQVSEKFQGFTQGKAFSYYATAVDETSFQKRSDVLQQ